MAIFDIIRDADALGWQAFFITCSAADNHTAFNACMTFGFFMGGIQ